MGQLAEGEEDSAWWGRWGRVPGGGRKLELSLNGSSSPLPGNESRDC